MTRRGGVAGRIALLCWFAAQAACLSAGGTSGHDGENDSAAPSDASARDDGTSEVGLTPGADATSDAGAAGDSAASSDAALLPEATPDAAVPQDASLDDSALVSDVGTTVTTDAAAGSDAGTGDLDASSDADQPVTVSAVTGPFAVDDGGVYFNQSEALARLDLATSQVQTLAPSGGSNILVDSTNVYWLGSKGIYACAKTGCGQTPTEIAAVASIGIFTIDSQNVYFALSSQIEVTASTGSLQSCPLAGCQGAPTTLVSGFVGPGLLSTPAGMTTDGVNVYWTMPLFSGGAVGTVVACPVSGCATPTVLASAQPNPAGIATDGTTVYWVNTGVITTHFPPAIGTLMSCAVVGCNDAPDQLLANLFVPVAVAVDATDVYFTEIGYPTGDLAFMPVPGLVGRLSRVDGSMVTLAGAEPGPSQIALNATSVYWMDFGFSVGQQGAGLRWLPK